MSAAEKALAACIAHTKAKDEIATLTREIWNHLGRCPGVNGGNVINPESWTYTPDETHLKRAYAGEVVGSFPEPYLRHRSEKEIIEMLSACQHCLSAHHAIQARKQARQKLGAARRWITKIGRAAA